MPQRYYEGVVKLEIDIPVSEKVLDEGAKARLLRDAREAAVLRLFEERRIPAVEAATELGLTRIDFMALSQKRGVPLYDYTIDDYQEDVKDLDKLWPEIEKNVRVWHDAGASVSIRVHR